MIGIINKLKNNTIITVIMVLVFGGLGISVSLLRLDRHEYNNIQNLTVDQFIQTQPEVLLTYIKHSTYVTDFVLLGMWVLFTSLQLVIIAILVWKCYND